MQQEIKLTNESSNTVFVDDVDVSKGVYCENKLKNKTGNNTHIILVQDSKLHVVAVVDTSGWPLKYDKLSDVIHSCSYFEFYTIPDNKRIVTEREVTIDDLKNTDHVGFVTDNGEKGHIVYYDGKLQLISTVGPSMAFCNYTYGSDSGSNMADAILKNTSSKKIEEVIRFTKRTGEGSLYEWLNKK